MSSQRKGYKRKIAYHEGACRGMRTRGRRVEVVEQHLSRRIERVIFNLPYAMINPGDSRATTVGLLVTASHAGRQT